MLNGTCLLVGVDVHVAFSCCDVNAPASNMVNGASMASFVHIYDVVLV